VKARNAARAWGEVGSSDGILVAPSVATIAEAKALADGAPVGLIDKIVTASFPGSFYIEEADRSSAILVLGPGPDAGALVTIGGIMGVNGVGERAILEPGTTVEAAPDPPRVPPPLFIVTEYLGGGPFNAGTPGRTGGVGLNNVGLLVQVCGQVQWIGEHEFTIWDGSAIGPIRVVASGFGTGGFEVGDTVSVTGISSLELDGGVLKPIIRLRGIEEIGKQD